jgi:flagellar motor switch protein FliN
MINIHITDDFSRQMAASMLTMEVEKIEGDQEIQAMFGELASIVDGSIKSVFGDTGLGCAISNPFFTKGTDFNIESLHMEKYEHFGFRCEENPVLVEMGIKISEVLQGAEPQEKDVNYSLEDSIGKEGAAEEERAKAEAPREPQSTMDPAPPKEKDFPAKENSKAREDFGLNLLLDIPLEIKVELGRTKIKIQELLKLASGSAIKLTKLDGEPVDILANDKLIARGEVVVQNQKYGIRVTEITRRMDCRNRFGW